MSESASLTVKMGLDGKPLKDGLNNAKQDAKSFAQSFERDLRETKGAVKDVSGSIDGMARAFDGSVQGAVGGFKDLIGLLAINPAAAFFSAVAGAIAGMATIAESSAKAAAEKLRKELDEFGKYAKQIASLREQNAQKEKEMTRPESPSREAIDFARKELDTATAQYEQDKKNNELLKQKIVSIREANRAIEDYSKTFGVSREEAFFALTPKTISPTGETPEAQRAKLNRMGFSTFDDETMRQALTGAGKAENASKEAQAIVEASRSKVLDAQKRLASEVDAYDKKRLAENEESTKAAYDKERKAEEDRLKLMADGHKEAAELARKNGEEFEKIEEQAAERRRAIWKKESEDKASAMQDAADEMSRLETSGGSFSSRYSADQYARVGGQIGGTSNMRELREAERQAAILEKGNEIQAKMLNRLEKIESQVSKAMDDTQ